MLQDDRALPVDHEALGHPRRAKLQLDPRIDVAADSFEGIAVGGDKLYLANERSLGRIIVVDLARLKVIDDFVAYPRGVDGWDVHYSDLCFFEGSLYALLRESRLVLQIDPATHRVLAEFNYRELENDKEVAYRTRYPLVGVMEGLAVDREFIWLATDNNGLSRIRYPGDIRPTLFKCRRTDQPARN